MDLSGDGARGAAGGGNAEVVAAGRHGAATGDEGLVLRAGGWREGCTSERADVAEECAGGVVDADVVEVGGVVGGVDVVGDLGGVVQRDGNEQSPQARGVL